MDLDYCILILALGDDQFVVYLSILNLSSQLLSPENKHTKYMYKSANALYLIHKL